MFQSDGLFDLCRLGFLGLLFACSVDYFSGSLAYRVHSVSFLGPVQVIVVLGSL